MRPSVRPEQIISETAPRIFPKFGMKLGVKNLRIVTRPLFLIYALFSRKPLICVKNIDVRAKFDVISGFLGLRGKTVPTIFLKFCQNVPKNILYYIEPFFHFFIDSISRKLLIYWKYAEICWNMLNRNTNFDVKIFFFSAKNPTQAEKAKTLLMTLLVLQT